MKHDAGFTLVEVIVATALTMTLTGVVVSLVAPGSSAGPMLPEAIDQAQRMRVANDALFRDLSQAGAGLSSGPHVGPLIRFFAPIVPRRMGASGADSFNTARTDAVTVRYVPDTLAQTTVNTFFLTSPTQANITTNSACGAAPFCGMAVGDDAFIFDRDGQVDTVTLRQVQGSVGIVQIHDAPATFNYQPGASLAQAVSRTYYLDAAQRQLRMYDGDQSDVPVVDGVVGMSLTYFGDPNPPRAPQPQLGAANCLYDAMGRLDPALATLPNSGTSLVPLPLSMFADGPWCGSGGARFDADLLRIRLIKVTLRVEATDDAFRGQGVAFAHPGTASAVRHMLADASLTFDVTPRNLNLTR